MLKKVSVVIPFYSGIQWLIEAVESALSQTHKNIEIIVVNDGSKEDVSEFLAKYGGLVIYRYQENQGAASARNHAMKLATGSYLAFLDSDDVWLPSKLEKQIAFMQETGAMWSHTSYFYWTPEKNTLKDVNIRDEYGELFSKTFVSVKIATPCVVLDVSIFKDHPDLGFPEGGRIGEDTKFWQDISKFYPVALLREPLVKVRLRHDNTYKKTILVLSLRGKDFQETKSNSEVPLVAKIRNFIFYLYSKIFQLPSTPLKDFLARCFLILPYLIGRIYVKCVSFLNKKYRYLVR